MYGEVGKLHWLERRFPFPFHFLFPICYPPPSKFHLSHLLSLSLQVLFFFLLSSLNFMDGKKKQRASNLTSCLAPHCNKDYNVILILLTEQEEANRSDRARGSRVPEGCLYAGRPISAPGRRISAPIIHLALLLGKVALIRRSVTGTLPHLKVI